MPCGQVKDGWIASNGLKPHGNGWIKSMGKRLGSVGIACSSWLVQLVQSPDWLIEFLTSEIFWVSHSMNPLGSFWLTLALTGAMHLRSFCQVCQRMEPHAHTSWADQLISASVGVACPSRGANRMNGKCALCTLSCTLRLEELCGKTIADSPLIWDLTNNVDYTYWKHQDYHHCLPCLLRNHTYWHVSAQRALLHTLAGAEHQLFSWFPMLLSFCQGRMLGVELLVLGHGFPRMTTAGLDFDGQPGSISESWPRPTKPTCHMSQFGTQEKDLNKIAGNSMSSPVVGSILAVALNGAVVQKLHQHIFHMVICFSFFFIGRRGMLFCTFVGGN